MFVSRDYIRYNEPMEKQFTTGQFAKLANVTERTIRYYDKIGLLKPSFIMENGYRNYCEEDFMKLQKIVSLKHLGFSLEEISTMVLKDNKETLNDSLELQMELIDKKIKHFQILKDSIISTKKMLKKDNVNWDKIVELIQLSTQEEKIIDHYQNAFNLAVRIKLHEQFSVNKVGWFPWLFSKMELTGVNRLLEIGSGNGELWKSNIVDVRNREVFLSDISQGMLENAKSSLGDKFSYMVIDCQKIPFKKGYFDAIVANHVLFYVNDVNTGLSEIARTLKEEGILYCSAYGSNHMKEITELAVEFDQRITLSDNRLYEEFGLDNGREILHPYFSSVTFVSYEDALEINEAKPIFDYIMSCHGNQKEILAGKSEEFMSFLERKIDLKGKIHVSKEAGLFICKK